MRKKRLLGILMGMAAALLWGISGPASEILFAHNMSVGWLISSKMVIAGLVSMVLAHHRWQKKVLAPWQNKQAATQMIIFILFGMIAMQYIYYQAVAVANAPTATILQFLSPVVVVIYVALKTRELPRRVDVLVIALAMFGTLLVVTKGHLTQLAISPQALMWGLLSALAAAAYAILPAALLETYSPLTVTAWAQLLGGALLSINMPWWTKIPHLTTFEWGLMPLLLSLGPLCLTCYI